MAQVDRKRHVWFWDRGRWKCALCGGVIWQEKKPGSDDEAVRYEPLSEKDRSNAPKR